MKTSLLSWHHNLLYTCAFILAFPSAASWAMDFEDEETLKADRLARQSIRSQKDERTHVSNTKVFPYSAQVYFKSIFSKGMEHGSGTFIDENVILTAGHVVYSRSEGVADLDCFPAKNGKLSPFTKPNIIGVKVAEPYKEQEKREDDYALVFVDRPIGRQRYEKGKIVDGKNYLDIDATEDEGKLKARSVTIAGYPPDRFDNKDGASLPTLWKMSGGLEAVEPEELYYDIDTTPGQSGSGIWYEDQDNFYLVGLHAYGADNSKELSHDQIHKRESHNHGPRLTLARKQKILGWIKAFKENTLVFDKKLAEEEKKDWDFQSLPSDQQDSLLGDLQRSDHRVVAIKNYSGLRDIHLNKWNNLKYLNQLAVSSSYFDSFMVEIISKRCLSLKEFVINNAERLDKIADENDQALFFRSLVKLNVSQSNKLKAVKVASIGLEEVQAKDCPRLKKVEMIGGGLKSLDLEGSKEIEDKVIDQVIEGNPHLQQLSLHGTSVTESAVREKYPRLWHHSEWSNENWQQILTQLKAGMEGSLKTLDLSNLQLNSHAMKLVFQSIGEDLLGLTALNLASNHFEERGLEDLFSVVQQMKSLTSLDLESNRLGDEGFKILAMFLLQMSSLADLNIDVSNIGASGFSLLLGIGDTLPQLKLKIAPSYFEKVIQCGIAKAASLDLRSNDLRAEGAKTLVPALQQLTFLTSLDLGRNCLGAEGVKVLVPALQQLTSLTSLDLGENYLGAEGAKPLAPALQQLTSLTSLHLGANKLGTEGVEALVPALQPLTSLTNLDLGDNDLGAEGMKALAPTLQQLTSLTNLDLSWNNLREEGLKVLVPALQEMSSLISLNLAINDLGAEDVKALAPTLQQLTSLTSLHLGSNKLGAECMKALAPALQQLTSLTILNLGHNDLGDEGMKALVPALQPLISLTTLHLGGNDVGAEGAKALAPTLQQLTFLTRLDLDWNGLGAECMKALAPALQQLTSLTSLNLGFNKLGAEGVEALVPALQQLTSLTFLTLENNKLGDDSVIALASALQQLTSLTILNLRGNELGAEGAKALAPALQPLTSLTTLNLCRNKLGTEGKKYINSLETSFPRLKIRY